MIIRETETQDWEILRSIRLQALSASPTAFGVRYEDAANNSDERWKVLASSQHPPYFWLAREQEMPVGMVGASLDEQRRFTLIGMWVNPQWRGTDIAQRLVQQVKARATKLGFAHIVLGVSPENARAVRFYQRQGFAFIEEYEWLNSHPYIRLQLMKCADRGML